MTGRTDAPVVVELREGDLVGTFEFEGRSWFWVHGPNGCAGIRQGFEVLPWTDPVVKAAFTRAVSEGRRRVAVRYARDDEGVVIWWKEGLPNRLLSAAIMLAGHENGEEVEEFEKTEDGIVVSMEDGQRWLFPKRFAEPMAGVSHSMRIVADDGVALLIGEDAGREAAAAVLGYADRGPAGPRKRPRAGGS